MHTCTQSAHPWEDTTRPVINTYTLLYRGARQSALRFSCDAKLKAHLKDLDGGMNADTPLI